MYYVYVMSVSCLYSFPALASLTSLFFFFFSCGILHHAAHTLFPPIFSHVCEIHTVVVCLTDLRAHTTYCQIMSLLTHWEEEEEVEEEGGGGGREAAWSVLLLQLAPHHKT